MTPDPEMRLEECPLVIFIAYTVGTDAEERGYADWLKRVDMPFFNAIPGTKHYANWRLGAIERGDPPPWDWFDFQGLEAEDDLERVWFNPDLDSFRTEWLRLWGYGRGEAPPVLRHAYLMRTVHASAHHPKADRLTLSAGTGAPPPGGADLVFRVDGVLHKHFGGREDGKAWLTPPAEDNPLGLDWLGVVYSAEGAAPDAATLVARAHLIAAPDR